MDDILKEANTNLCSKEKVLYASLYLRVVLYMHKSWEHQYIGKDTGICSFMFNQESAAMLFLFWTSMFLFIVQH